MSKYDYLHYFHFYFTNNLVNQYGLTYDEIIKVIEENYDINIVKHCLMFSQSSVYLDLIME
jgi:hypothetical protein